MTRTNILCPNCTKGKLLTTNDDAVNDNRTWCDQCGEDFIRTGTNSVRFGQEPNTNPAEACLTQSGGTCKASAFQYRKLYEGVVPAGIPTVDYKTIADIDDGNKYQWHVLGRDKYGRDMYCPKTQIKRTQTMGEFYGGGTVD